MLCLYISVQRTNIKVFNLIDARATMAFVQGVNVPFYWDETTIFFIEKKCFVSETIELKAF